jgi:hypothetical protein
MRKKFATLFLLLVLSIQALPVKQMGMALFSNLFTEEIAHSAHADQDCCKKAKCKSDFIETPVFSFASAQFDLPFKSDFSAASIPQNHTGDIHVPPPNC